MSMEPRINRLFAADGKCIQIALDHALSNEYGLLAGVENLREVLRRVVDAGVEGVLLSPGSARHLQSMRTDRKPALVMRADVGNLYEKRRPEYGFCRLIEAPVERALRLDAAAVLLNLFHVPDNPAVYEQCLENIARVKADCEDYGMPLVVEPLVLVRDDTGHRYTLSGDSELLLPLHRQAVELGADVIKADPTNNVAEYRRFVEMAGGVPLLPRGGAKVGTGEILRRTHTMIQAGVAGVVYGRNVFQHEDLPGMVRALRAIIHEGAQPEDAARLVRGLGA
jgi:fructose-bisphosphate aldolase, class I